MFSTPGLESSFLRHLSVQPMPSPVFPVRVCARTRLSTLLAAALLSLGSITANAADDAAPPPHAAAAGQHAAGPGHAKAKHAGASAHKGASGARSPGAHAPGAKAGSSAARHAAKPRGAAAAKPSRSPAQRMAFVRNHPCPSTGKTSGACPGYVVDHIKPLACGGADRPANMQWQRVSAAKAKDRAERRDCRAGA